MTSEGPAARTHMTSPARTTRLHLHMGAHLIWHAGRREAEGAMSTICHGAVRANQSPHKPAPSCAGAGLASRPVFKCLNFFVPSKHALSKVVWYMSRGPAGSLVVLVCGLVVLFCFASFSRCCWLVGWLVETRRRCVTTSGVAAPATAIAIASVSHAAAVVAVAAE